ncbi:uncharacterized protein NPIL_318211 [Nephila pilipes]|uniref:Cytochrome c oxidase subunit 4 n=1 Tax=Nephila pilipes TaxID=299642 RepID=A0A8X6PNZ5_NEPPI|nr:uncharacterized protein NPIL_318211 [Nephila pilipes]
MPTQLGLGGKKCPVERLYRKKHWKRLLGECTTALNGKCAQQLTSKRFKEFNDPCVTDSSKPCKNDRTAAIVTLKQKEKGDWRNLTLEEKQALYHMSFSQPFCDVLYEPADEWKLILAGAFTTMGLMTLGMYIWLSQNEHAEDVVGPLSVKKELKDMEEIRLIHESNLVKTA